LGIKTLKGKEIKETLERSKLQIGKISFYDSSVESEWSLLTEFRGEPYLVKYPTEDIFKEARIILLAYPGDIELKTVSKAEEEGVFVIDLSNSFNEDENVPLIVDGINHELIKKSFILANPHPLSIILSLIVHKLKEKFEIENLSSVAFQPVSEYQEEGVQEFINQTVAILNATSVPRKILKEQRAFDLIPENEKNERKILRELDRILGIKSFSITVIKAPIFHCFAVITFLTIHGDPTVEEIETLLKKEQRFKIFARGQTPTPVLVAGRDEIFVKISKNANVPSRYTIWAVADNFRSGFAKNAIRIIHRIVSMR
jgi:aspartate-semialdehyde dehydrogenase